MAWPVRLRELALRLSRTTAWNADRAIYCVRLSVRNLIKIPRQRPHFELQRLQRYTEENNYVNLTLPVDVQKLAAFQLQSGFAPDSLLPDVP